MLTSGKLPHAQPGAFADERAGGDVPPLHGALEVGVVAAGCRPREIERRAAEAADVTDLADQAREHLCLRLAHARVVIEAGRDHQMSEGITPGVSASPLRPLQLELSRRAAECLRAVPRRAEELVAIGVIDGPRDDPLTVADGHAHAPLRDPEDEVDRAVERVDDPSQPALPRGRAPALLAQEAIVRSARGQQLAYRALGRVVRLADQVRGRALARHLPHRAALEVLQQKRPGHARGPDRQPEQLARIESGLDSVHPSGNLMYRAVRVLSGYLRSRLRRTA